MFASILIVQKFTETSRLPTQANSHVLSIYMFMGTIESDIKNFIYAKPCMFAQGNTHVPVLVMSH